MGLTNAYDTVHRCWCLIMMTIATLVRPRGRYLEAATISGWTPLHFAASRNQAAAVSFLLQHGANILAVNRVRARRGHLNLGYSSHVRLCNLPPACSLSYSASQRIQMCLST